ncbi:Rieske (2Fe-2S) protein [Pontixanthobacter aquaemixtae]|uniref:Rieske 2Fe-2S domain-containing protein n=1 Tax=Pontixanthobacter aquaemixtae TaxID=1958940 RepID=A0A844ZWX0_9SPHN|nr:non-heme iron oxygenase ferredoxin subunit [Pontixanthobacter aquaemixtae]MXO89999.1 Rieske 2Fe-2S domain-containing protein [Pontixanthobacter aquaemixtae]
MEENWVKLCRVSEIKSGTAVAKEVGGVSVLICHINDQFHAIKNECSHAFQCLEGGVMRGGWIACPAHGARFDLKSGEPLNPPATESIEVFPVKVESGMIMLDASSIA